MISTFGSVADGGSAAPGLQTERPADEGRPALVHVVRYVPLSSHAKPAGQHVCRFGQHTAPSYGQQPWPLPE